MRRSLDLRVYGEPAPQGSKKYVGQGRFVESSKKVAPWRKAIAKAVSELPEWEPFTEPVMVRVIFFLPRPSSVKRPLPSVAPDLDKLQRSLGDGLSIDSRNENGETLIADDSLIVRWESQKFYADFIEPGAVLTIIELDPPTLLERIYSRVIGGVETIRALFGPRSCECELCECSLFDTPDEELT